MEVEVGMKWCNKQRTRKNWHAVPFETEGDVYELIQRLEQGLFVPSVVSLKQWAVQHDSDGKFFYSHKTNNWYFEKGEDAILFKLKFL